MEKRKFEKLGIETSLLGFGCMRFPATPDGKIDEPRAEKLLDRAIAAGVNYIDTAYPYHNGDRLSAKCCRNMTAIPFIWQQSCLSGQLRV
jgi:predicted aldo/keto reductase-like oxidoreductase